MAEYYAVLSKAIAGLTTASPDTRRAVYDKARNALIGQLRAIDPPLPTAEISRQRLELEEAIRRVEREILTGDLPPPPPRQPQIQSVPPPPPRSAPASPPPELAAADPAGRRSPQDIFRQAIRDAESREPAPPAAAERPRRAPPQRPAPVARSSAAARQAPPEDAYDPGISGDITPDMDESAPPLAAEPAIALPSSARGLKPSSRPGNSRKQSDYAFDEGEQPPRAMRPPERAREVRLGPAPIDPRIDDVAQPRRGARRNDPADETAMDEPPRRRSRVALIIIALLVIVVGGVAYAGWTQWGKISALVAVFNKPGTASNTPAPSTPPSAATAIVVPSDSSKNGDRLLPNGQTVPGPTPVAPPSPFATAPTPSPAPAPGTQPSSPAPGGVRIVGQDAGVTPTVPAPGQIASLPNASANTQAGPTVTQKATLYEEPLDPTVKGGFAVAGTVSWSFVNSPTDGPEVVGMASIPDRKLTVKIVVHRNTDKTLPASHLIELSVMTGADFPGKSVQNIPTITLGATEPESGSVLMGASATVGPGLYWIALSNAPKDINTNLSLFRNRTWMNIHVVYQTGQRASLVLEEGPAGTQAFSQAVTAWQAG